MEASRPDIEVRLLGAPEVLVASRPVAIGSLKQWTVLAALVLEPGGALSSDRLIDALWGPAPPASAGTTLRSLVYRLRRALDMADELQATAVGYVFTLGREAVDVVRFERLAARGRAALGRGEFDAAVADLTAALALWRGSALHELRDCDYFTVEAHRLDEARLAAVEDLAEAELGLGLEPAVVARLEPHLAVHPARERAYSALMVALYRLGRQVDALAAYRRLRSLLADEYGIEPNPALRTLEAAILRQDAALLRAPALPAVHGRVPGPVRHNFPSAPNAFIGRGEEVEAVREGLAERLLTLVGPGGVGKTRLALEAAREVVGHFPDGARLVELAPIRDPSLVAPGLATALGLDAAALGGTGRSFVEALAEALRERRLLVVLDNCEHVVEAAAELTHTVVSRCPGVTVLATSREPLGVAGETILPVAPLSLPPDDSAEVVLSGRSDAVNLFCERARQSAGEFALTAENAAAVARICRRLDGSPLALELAAARIRALSPEQVADRLDDRFRLLTRGWRTAEVRHQSLQAAVDWSHDLLAPAEQALLRRLAVFAGDFDLTAAEAVAAGAEPVAPSDVLDLLGRLVDRSLVMTVPEASAVRYRLLETIRQYAYERLTEAGETGAARDRHCAHFAALPPDWFDLAITPRQMRRVGRDRADLRLAMEWAWERADGAALGRLAAFQWLYWMNEPAADALDWLERAVAAGGSAAPDSQVHVRIGLAYALLSAGSQNAARAVALLEEALAIAGPVGGVAEAASAVAMAQLCAAQGRWDAASTHVDRALPLLRQTGQRRFECFVLSVQAEMHIARGDLGGARAGFEHALTRPGAAEDSYALPHILGMLALLDAVAGNGRLAAERAERGLEIARRFSPRVITVMGLVRAAEVAVLTRELGTACARLDELLAVQRELGSPRWVADALELTAVVLGADRPEAVASLLGHAVGLRGSMREAGGFPAEIGELISRCSAAATQALGPDAAAACSRAGAELGLDEALGLARAELAAAVAAALDHDDVVVPLRRRFGS